MQCCHLFMCICLRFDVDRMWIEFGFVIPRDRIIWTFAIVRLCMHTDFIFKLAFGFYLHTTIYHPFIRSFTLQYISIRSFRTHYAFLLRSLFLLHSALRSLFHFKHFCVPQLLPHTIAHLIGRLRFISFAHN